MNEWLCVVLSHLRAYTTTTCFTIPFPTYFVARSAFPQQKVGSGGISVLFAPTDVSWLLEQVVVPYKYCRLHLVLSSVCSTQSNFCST